jgi:AcrR family transcriptional regulator
MAIGGTVTSMNTMSTQKRRYELKARAEAQQATRERIAAAAASLHEEVGVARTTVADIARRAGVQRLTVYNHFPDLETLLPACTAHWLAEHPLPDLGPLLALEEPVDRLRATLTALYRWYRENASMQRRMRGERATVPELDAWMAQSSDVTLTELAGALAAGFERPHAHALVALALDFWTWRRLDAEGLDDAAAAGLMTAAVACAPAPARPARARARRARASPAVRRRGRFANP